MKRKNSDVILFDDTSLADVMREIHRSREENRVLLTDAIAAFRQKIAGPGVDIESLSWVGKVIADLFGELVDNDENLIKLAAIVQRLLAAEGKVQEEKGLITEEEKRQLLRNVKEDLEDLAKETKEPVIEEFARSVRAGAAN